MTQSSKRLSRKTRRSILVGAIAVWILLSIVGFVTGYELANTNRMVAGVVGIMLAGFLWVALCWTSALTARHQLIKRGYALSPRRTTR